MTPTGRSLRALFAALFAASLPPSLAFAASHTWGGLLSGGWSIGVNWTSGGAPMPNETGVVLVFPAGQQHMDIMVNDVTGLNVTSITIGDSAYVISGNAISLDGS
ncbi:MAG TPA: hypothetical protein VGR00_09265, partial [Thermoanaerobaculia bacterium]|nr:hypothetical protein [Thermoanaerobaculia bacterium]